MSSRDTDTIFAGELVPGDAIHHDGRGRRVMESYRTTDGATGERCQLVKLKAATGKFCWYSLPTTMVVQYAGTFTERQGLRQGPDSGPNLYEVVWRRVVESPVEFRSTQVASNAVSAAAAARGADVEDFDYRGSPVRQDVSHWVDKMTGVLVTTKYLGKASGKVDLNAE